MLVDCNRQGALIYADRTLERVEGWRAEEGGVSCGIALFHGEMVSKEELIEAARDALGTAIAAGGSRIEIHGETHGE
jgi:PleD family two-component response regulator